MIKDGIFHLENHHFAKKRNDGTVEIFQTESNEPADPKQTYMHLIGPEKTKEFAEFIHPSAPTAPVFNTVRFKKPTKVKIKGKIIGKKKKK